MSALELKEPLPRELLDPYEQRWTHPYESKVECELHRLSALRDLSRAIHARRSAMLAQGEQSQARAYRNWEAQINRLRDLSSLNVPFSEVLFMQPDPKKPKFHFIPEGLAAAITREKFERYDREWEKALAAQACVAGWRFWAIEVWVEISKAEEFHLGLVQTIDPHGIVLFSESSSTADAPMGVRPSAPDRWHGRWILAVQPRFETPEFRINSLPGVTLNEGHPQWKHLFSSKTL